MKKELTAEEKQARAEKARATRAANKAMREARAREQADREQYRREMLEKMKYLAEHGDLDDNTKARLLIEIKELDDAIPDYNPPRRYGGGGRYHPGLAYGMF